MLVTRGSVPVYASTYLDVCPEIETGDIETLIFVVRCRSDLSMRFLSKLTAKGDFATTTLAAPPSTSTSDEDRMLVYFNFTLLKSLSLILHQQEKEMLMREGCRNGQFKNLDTTTKTQ